MKIWLECEFEVTHHEFDNGTVKLETVTFPGFTQNLLPFMSISEQDAAQQAVEDEVEKEAIAKVERLLEKKAMAADRRRDMVREIQQDTLRELSLQRGVR